MVLFILMRFNTPAGPIILNNIKYKVQKFGYRDSKDTFEQP